MIKEEMIKYKASLLQINFDVRQYVLFVVKENNLHHRLS
jgi:hypothetical protein